MNAEELIKNSQFLLVIMTANMIAMITKATNPISGW
jgi:hypothetical protein